MNGKTIHDWWQRPLRAVTLEFPAADVATIDVRAIIDEAHAGAVNTLVVFSTGYYPGGTAFYPSRVAPHYPGLGSRDLLAESIEAARRNGQRVIAYLASIWGNREMYFAHPDWAQRKADGRVTSWDDEFNSVAMDPLSPYREYFARVAAEISESYDVDGFYFDEPSFQSWSASAACQRAFQEEFGVPLPTVENWARPGLPAFHPVALSADSRLAGIALCACQTTGALHILSGSIPAGFASIAARGLRRAAYRVLLRAAFCRELAGANGAWGRYCARDRIRRPAPF